MDLNVVGNKYNIIIDCDTGIDDAYTLILACKCSDTFNLVGVTTVAGNVDVEMVTANTCVVLDAVDASLELPVCKGFGVALLERPHFCPEIHGSDGLGDVDRVELGLETPSQRVVDKRHAVDFIVEQAMAHAERYERAIAEGVEPSRASLEQKLTLVALAPMTNVAMALRREPRCARGLRQIVFMGGAAARGGNATAWAEANVACDPEAARIVFTAGVPLLMYPWDVFEEFRFDSDAARALLNATSRAARLAGALLLSEMRRFEQTFAALGDAGTLVALLRPDATRRRLLHVDVELSGALTRGMTVVDWRERVCPPDQVCSVFVLLCVCCLQYLFCLIHKRTT
jgi:pyrimidine-specific ribonucleoside hydrolase